MRILMVNTYYAPNIVGGTEVSVKILSEGLVDKGHDVAVYSLDGEKDIVEYVNKVLVYRSCIDKVSYFTKLMNSIFNRKIAIRLRKIIDDFSPDVIHTNNFESLSTIWIVAKEYNIPVVHTIRDYQYYPIPMIRNEKYDDNLILRYIRKIGFAYRGRLFSYFLMKVAYVTTASKFILEKFYHVGYVNKNNSVVIPNCIDFNLNEVKENIKNKGNREEDKIKFLFAGRLEKEKGIIELIDAFTKINSDIELLICGAGELKGFILSKVKEDPRIKYLGKLDKKRMEEIYYDVDVVVIPSVWEEPFGRIIIEGARGGNAIIVSDRGGMPEIVKKLHCGEIFYWNEANGLVNKMINMSNRNNIRRYIKEIPAYLGEYSLDKQLDSFEDLYKNVLDKKVGA